MKTHSRYWSSTLCLLALSIIAPAACAGDDPASLHRAGLVLLQKALAGDDAQVVSAAELFARASAGFVAAGDEQAACQSNSCLYWCRKRMTLAQTGTFSARRNVSPEIEKGAQTLDAKVDDGQAAAFLERADEFARKNPADFLQVAVRYFEVADRFQGTPASLKAQQVSLETMKKIRVSQFGAPKVVTQEEVRSLPAVAKACQAFEASVLKAKERYSKELAPAAAAAQRAGNLDLVKEVDAERAFLESSGVNSSAPLKTPALAALQQQYNAEADAARAALIQALDAAKSEEVRKGNTAHAESLNALLENERARLDLDLALPGEWKSKNGGPWTFTLNHKKMELREGNGFSSVFSARVGNAYLFKWSNRSDAMWVERRNDSVFLSCYPSYFSKLNFKAEKPAGKPSFETELKKKIK